MTTIDKARTFIHRNARPVTLALWRFHFEGGSVQEVLSALGFYQNADGGFGHGLEADCWNPESAPIQTWEAGRILLAVNAPRECELVQGILRYLGSGADFDEAHQQWLNVVPGNNDYPHAIWWSYGDAGSDFQYNPTAMLAGFAVLYAEKGSTLYAKARRIADEAIAWLQTGAAGGDSHVVACFLQLRECLRRAGEAISPAFDAALRETLHQAICTDPEKWRTDYVCRPSMLFSSAKDPFCADFAEAIQAECAMLPETQGEDGSWPVPWAWYTEYTKEFEVAKNWWKGHIILERMLFLRAFGRL